MPPRPFPVVEVDLGRKGSLKRMCVKKIASQISLIHSVGDMRYELARKFLCRVETATQLHEIEKNSPQIRNEDGELWERFIKRDFPAYKDSIVAPDDGDWYNTYMSYKDQDTMDEIMAKEQLRGAMAAINKDRAAQVSQKVEARRMPKPPRDPKMVANNGILLAGRGRGPGTYTPVKPKNAIDKARMEAANAARLRKNAQAMIPTNLAQIRKAPAAMLDEAERSARNKSAIPPPPPSAKEEKMSILDKKAAEVRAAKEAKMREKIEQDREARRLNAGDGPASMQAFDPSSTANGSKPANIPRMGVPQAPPRKMMARKKEVDIFLAAKKRPAPAPAAPKPTAPRPTTTNTNMRPVAAKPTGRPQAITGRFSVGAGSKNAAERAFLRPVTAVADRKGASTVISQNKKNASPPMPGSARPITSVPDRRDANVLITQRSRESSPVKIAAPQQAKPSIMDHISQDLSKDDERKMGSPVKRRAEEQIDRAQIKRQALDVSRPGRRLQAPIFSFPQSSPPKPQKRPADDDDNDSLFGSPPPSPKRARVSPPTSTSTSTSSDKADQSTTLSRTHKPARLNFP